MSAGKKNGISCLDVYRASLEVRIQRGEWDLVCRDEDMCKEIETRLSECSPQNVHCHLGLDTLSVIETSLRASCHTLGQNRLKNLVKAFEVLELAALNLYLCPWRKEYKVVKMFSGMFTHCIKSAMTMQQAKELFALLGYHPAGSSEDELRLSTKPVNSHTLLQLAFGFFIARIECQLLLNAVASLGGNMEWLLQLIHERKRDCPFEKALDSAKRKLEPACHTPLALDATLDLYTEHLPEHSDMVSPPSLLYIPPSDDPLPYKTSHSNTSQSSKERNEMKAQTVTISSLTCQITAPTQKTDSSLKLGEDKGQLAARCDAQLGVSKQGQYLCNCSQSYKSCQKQCLECSEIHSVDCPCFKSCIKQRHQHMMNAQYMTRQDQTHSWKKTPKDDLKQHSCINNPSNDFFCVCYDCQYIHDVKCEKLKTCYQLHHNVQNTGRLQPAQVESEVIAHTCCKVQETNHVVCHTCSKSHNWNCTELEGCHMSDHSISYFLVNNEETTPAMPMPLHQCCTSIKPDFACLTCRVFHADFCDDNLCEEQHQVQRLKGMCSLCLGTELYILCRYCCAQQCKNCWFKDPLNCKCGMPITVSDV